jgi:ribosomal peptide maturation radical SAM protein 1
MELVTILNGAASKHSSRSTRVALVNVPFALADRPSIQCGLLKAELVQQGHHVDVFYLNLELAAELGPLMYKTISQLRTEQFLGEWLFSVAAFGYRPNENAFRDACPSLQRTCREMNTSFAELCELRNKRLPGWVTRWTEQIDWGSYQAVGFTSTFEQNCAAFALARLIKQRHHEIVTIFGGANFDADMGKEFLRALPFIDYIVTGEGDYALPELIARLSGGHSCRDLDGVSGREGGELFFGNAAQSVLDLDLLPVPDYDEYFETLFRLEASRVLGDAPPLLLYESARGCWWGQRHHCTFCGLNANGMRFRSKTAGRVLDQLRFLSERYKVVNFEAVDNIMDMGYLDALCRALSQDHCDYRIFYEVKANLRPDQLRLMARAGINSIQPGIESLSTHVLRLMRKGITMLKNVRILKWAYYYGMRVGWNLLTGFPGENKCDYEGQCRTVPLLLHLPPPFGCGPIWLERFSPYYFDDSFPVKNIRPRDGYRFIYPDSQIDLHKIAYFFEHEMDSALQVDDYTELMSLVAAWKSRWDHPPQPVLVYQRAPDWMQVIDRRGTHVRAHSFHRHEALIYELCGETDQSVDGICRHLQRVEGESSVQEGRVRAALENFCNLGLMVGEDGCFFSLALPANPYW